MVIHGGIFSVLVELARYLGGNNCNLALFAECAKNEFVSSNNPSTKSFLQNKSLFNFLSTCNSLPDALSVMKKLVKVFQVCDVDFSILKPIVQSAILTLQTQATTPGPRLAAFLVAVGEDKCEVHLDHKTHDTQQQRAQLANIREKFTEKLISNLQNRFPEQEKNLLNAMVIFDMEQLPTVATLNLRRVALLNLRFF